MNLNGSVYSHRIPHDMLAYDLDIDTVDNMLYYLDWDDRSIKRAIIDNTTAETLYTHDGLYVMDIAIDWIGRYFSGSLILYLYLSMNYHS